MASEGLHVVLGAGGGSGSAVVRELTEQGAHVRAVTRAAATLPEGVHHVRADVSTAEGARHATEGAAVVYHCVNVPYQQWYDKLLPIAANVLDGAAAAGARLVMMDNLYMYGAGAGVMTETTPRAATGRKGRLRAELERRLLEAHEAGRVQVVIGRASDFYGPGAGSVPSMMVFDRLAAGRTAFWVGRLDVPHTLHYLPDVARSLVILAGSDEAFGEVWHLPADEPLTGRQLIDLVAQGFGVRPRARRLGSGMMRLAGVVQPQVREVLELSYQFEAPFVADSSKFTAAFGRRITAHADAVKATVASYRANTGG